MDHVNGGEHGGVGTAGRSGAAGADPSLDVREPRQERSRRRWSQVLDAGVALVEEGGFDALTIAAVCERAEVPPRFIYERVDTKEALLVAVYEHAMLRIRAGEVVFDDAERWAAMAPAAAVDAAVREVAALFRRNRALLRAVVLDSSRYDEVRRRGSRYTDVLRERFAGSLRPLLGDGAPIDAVFRAVFASLVFRAAYGADFLAPKVSEARFVDELVTIAIASLLAD